MVSGTSGSYLKTSAIIEHGNSGGGAYSKDGVFIGIPSAVVKGGLNALGYVLSIDTINNWLGNTSIAYTNNSNNNYSRVSSVLETIDLEKLGLLQLVITPSTESKKTAPVSNPKPASIPKSDPSVQTQKQNQISSDSNTTTIKSDQEISSSTSTSLAQNEKPAQTSWTRRVLNWFIKLFK